jgi:hypothetical protein
MGFLFEFSYEDMHIKHKNINGKTFMMNYREYMYQGTPHKPVY